MFFLAESEKSETGKKPDPEGGGKTDLNWKL